MATLAQKVRFLSDPRSYAHTPDAVEPLETHMSWVFLAGNLVYKFKKPIRMPFLDFSTLAAREHNCRDEFRLNKRLAQETYNRVVPITNSPQHGLAIDGDGPIVEWLVEMNRLPQDAVMEAHIARGDLSRDDIVNIAERLAHFYQQSPPQIADGSLYLDHLEHEHTINEKILLRSEFGLTDEATRATIDTVRQLLKSVRGEIETRIEKGLIVEGHGDLRPEHIYLTNPIQIIDCLEFDRSMRILDPYDEVNYLGLECRKLGQEWIGPLLLQTLNTYLATPPSSALMAFYTAFRAVLRARICIAHLLDDHPMTPEKWPRRTREYLELARTACATPSAPTDDGSNRHHAGA